MDDDNEHFKGEKNLAPHGVIEEKLSYRDSLKTVTLPNLMKDIKRMKSKR